MAALPKVSQSYRVSPSVARLVGNDIGPWQRQQLPRELGECYSERIALDDGLALVRSRYHPRRSLIEETLNPHDRPMLVITFAMQGESGYKGADGSAVAFRAGYTTVTAFQLSRGERCYQADATVSQLRLLVGESTLNTYLGSERTGQLLGNGHIRQLAFNKTSAASLGHARALARLPGDDLTATLDMHIHTLSLLREQLHALGSAVIKPPGYRLNAVDSEKLDRVRDIMAQQMDQPLTVAYLCAAVGLNEFKLKEGMRQRFNATPHRMLHELRMRRAYTLLESGCQVAQAAWQVGYRFPNNFSVAFTRYFGKSPKSVFGKRR